MNIIEKAIQFATKAHEGACRKGTTLPYILHPLEAGAIAAQMTGSGSAVFGLFETEEDAKAALPAVSDAAFSAVCYSL